MKSGDELRRKEGRRAKAPYAPDGGAERQSTNERLAEFGFPDARHIGGGAMGTIWLWAPPGEIDEVIIKTPAYDTEDYRTRLAQEGTNLGKLNHPNIVVCRQVDSAGRYLVLDYVQGCQLKDADLSGKSATEVVEEILIPLADALKHAHAQSVIHRDLSYSNIIVGDNGPVVIDFGLSVDPGTTTRVTKTGKNWGTRPFMSPEQLRDMKYVDGKTDVYSLGVIAYWLFVKELPFDCKDEAKQLELKDEGRFKKSEQLRSHAGQALAGIIENLVHPDATKRLSAGALVEQLQSWLDSGSASARGIRGGEVVVKRISRKRKLLGGTAAFAILAVVAWFAVESANIKADAARDELVQQNDVLAVEANREIKLLLTELRPLIEEHPEKLKSLSELYERRLRALSEMVRNGDPGLRAQLANVALQIGDLHGDPGGYSTGDSDRGLAYYEWAISEFEALSKQEPANIMFQRSLAQLLSRRGRRFRANEAWEDARADFEKALGIRQRVATERNRNTLLSLAVSFDDLGDLAFDLDRAREAWGYYLRALEQRKKAINAPLADGELPTDAVGNALAVSRRKLEELSDLVGERLPAIPVPADESARPPRFGSDVVASLNRSRRFLAAGNVEEAIAEADNAVRVMATHTPPEQMSGSYRVRYGSALLHRSRAYSVNDEWSKARDDVDSACPHLESGSPTPENTRTLAELYFQEGKLLKHEERTADALSAWQRTLEKLKPLPRTPASDSLALCALTDMALVNNERGNSRESVSLLRKTLPLVDNLTQKELGRASLPASASVNRRLMLAAALWQLGHKEKGRKIQLFSEAADLAFDAKEKLETADIPPNIAEQLRSRIVNEFGPLLKAREQDARTRTASQ